ncbi:hypothetical protein [Candidatus Liberibacter africanus]|uniref:hypothetical protein n=1 Tax=Liberibacter africanus TaxID=34020 RepID=UPI001FD166F1|nr:hypothetical protein [Candidatus Liberibacter africanus]
MRLENGLAISLILHVVFLLLLYFSFNIKLFIPVSQNEMFAVRNIYNEDFHSGKYNDDTRKREKKQTPSLKEESKKNIVEENGVILPDQRNIDAVEDGMKNFPNKGGQESKEVSEVITSPRFEKPQDIKMTNKAGTPSAKKKSIESVIRSDKKGKGALPRSGIRQSNKIFLRMQ